MAKTCLLGVVASQFYGKMEKVKENPPQKYEPKKYNRFIVIRDCGYEGEDFSGAPSFENLEEAIANATKNKYDQSYIFDCDKRMVIWDCGKMLESF